MWFKRMAGRAVSVTTLTQNTKSCLRKVKRMGKAGRGEQSRVRWSRKKRWKRRKEHKLLLRRQKQTPTTFPTGKDIHRLGLQDRASNGSHNKGRCSCILGWPQTLLVTPTRSTDSLSLLTLCRGNRHILKVHPLAKRKTCP